MSNDSRPPPDTDELQRLYATRPGADAAPTDDELAALALDELDGAERLRVLDAMIASPEAAERYRVLVDLHRDIDDRRPRRRRKRWFAVAAAILAGAVGLSTLIPTAVEQPRVRGDNAAVVPSRNQALAAAPGALHWGAAAGDPPYRVALYDDAANRLWTESGVTNGDLALTDAQRGAMSAGHAYFWTVVDGSGREFGPWWFRVGTDP
jgi:hypothetical protein